MSVNELGCTVTIGEAGRQIKRDYIRSWGIERRAVKARNFDVEIENTEEGDIITLRQKNTSRTRLLNDFLPPGTSFGAIGWNYSLGNKYAGYEVDQLPHLDDAVGVLSLLHEVGHMHHFQGIVDDLPQDMGDQAIAEAIIIEEFSNLSPEFSKEEFKNAFARLDIIEDRAELTNWDLFLEEKIGQELPEWVHEARDVYAGESERSAWAYAISKARELEREGFNVLSDFKDNMQVIAYAESCMTTYERGRYGRLTRNARQEDLYEPRYIRIRK